MQLAFAASIVLANVGCVRQYQLALRGDQELACDSGSGEQDCKIPLEVKATPDTQGKCTVYFTYTKIWARLGVSLIWELDNKSDYEFYSLQEKTRGIHSRSPLSGAFVEHGYYAPPGGTTPDRGAYKWYSRGLKPNTEFHYDIYVRKKGGTEPCKAEDPVVVNRG